MDAGHILSVHPVLPCKSVPDTIEFYCSKLGFEVAFSYPEIPTYAGIGRNGIQLHLQQHDESEWARIERPQFRFLVRDIDAIFGEFKQSTALQSNVTIRETAWGTREFGLFDPNSNGLTFYVSHQSES